VLVVPHAAAKAALEAHADEITALARLSKVTVHAGSAPHPEQASVKVFEDVQVIVPLTGVVDFADEAARLKKSIEKAAAERDKIVKKLSNEGFLAKAPAEVVEKDRGRVRELEEMLQKLRESLKRTGVA
jgi:valyl-tRNA synthetase